MHVDGFRFDLASVLGRTDEGFQQQSAFFAAAAQDPVLSRVKLIAEPWDLGTYQVGNFPVDWAEWNGQYRDTVRRFLKGDEGQLRALGYRLTGSSDLYGDDGRAPYNSINFITCHDGFTLRDLFTYGRKHNDANGEENRDGTNDNDSWNHGVEGETDDPGINRLRRRQVKNAIATLVLSAGTPMLLGGDEMIRTQRGNNNAYCQDNELSWFDWSDATNNADIVEFTRRAIAFRRRHPSLRRRAFFTGIDHDGDGIPDIAWYDDHGHPPEWWNPQARTLCFLVDGNDPDPRHRTDHVFIALNADWQTRDVRLPALPRSQRWRRAADTALDAGDDFREPGREADLAAQDAYPVQGRSVVVLLGS
jgi:glycogen operon protein